jgi:tRNA/rRNA methyltransferase
MGADGDTSLDIASSSRPVIILARPQMGENIGACARAMKNCGVYDLRLIAPRDGWPNPLARPMATVATDILDSATVYDRLADALDDVGLLLATTARLRDMEKPVMNPRQALAYALELPAVNLAGRHRIALLFGAERSGLDNDEIALADIIVQADLNPESRSLNIAQAVFMMCWEWRMAALSGSQNAVRPENMAVSPPADIKSRDYFFERMETVLDAEGFFSSKDIAPTVKRNLRNFFTRGQPTEQELRTLHGILSLFDKNGR